MANIVKFLHITLCINFVLLVDSIVVNFRFQYYHCYLKCKKQYFVRITELVFCQNYSSNVRRPFMNVGEYKNYLFLRSFCCLKNSNFRNCNKRKNITVRLVFIKTVVLNEEFLTHPNLKENTKFIDVLMII